MELRPLSSVDGALMAEPTSPQTTQVLECVECCRRWRVPSERWRVYVTDDDPPELVAYCRVCAEREFG
jgi:hypothetical protein